MTNNIREKLVELIYHFVDYLSKREAKYLADHLIANNVTVQTEEEKWNALNEAYDLGVDSVLHDHFGLSWDDAAELRKEVKRLQEATKWIPVSERLPEKDGCYLVTACDEGCPYGEGIWYDTVVVLADYYDDGRWVWYEGVTEYDLCDIVTHWMPMPQPPKGE